MFSLAIATSAGIYLFEIETDHECKSFNAESGGETVSVSKRYNIVLLIYFTIGIVDSIRTLAVLVAIFSNKHTFVKIYTYLSCVEILSLIGFIIIHLYRF